MTKKLLRTALQTAVTAVFQQYRVSGHLEKDQAIDTVCSELQSMKSTRRGTLLSKSEWRQTLKRNLPWWKRRLV